MISVVQAAIYHRASDILARAATSTARSALKLILRLPFKGFLVPFFGNSLLPLYGKIVDLQVGFGVGTTMGTKI
jgi:hypothetical protein